jgi:hypothetical protein
MSRRTIRWRRAIAPLIAGLAVGGCGGSVLAGHVGRHRRAAARPPSTAPVSTAAPVGARDQVTASEFPLVATKNTTRVPSDSPVADAAAIALATFPSAAPGTHPAAVVLAPTGDWQASLAAAVLMASPLHAPLLFASGPGSLPGATAAALRALAPTGARILGGAQVIRIGPVSKPGGYRTASIFGADPYALAGAIDRFQTVAAGHPSVDVVIASGSDPAYAMPAAGWAAESGDPILFVTARSIPGPTRKALAAADHPHIYVLGPPRVIANRVLAQLRRYGTVRRIGASARSPAASSVAFAEYRDPPCVYEQPCAHIPGSFGWAIRSPGHGYVLLNVSQPLDAAAAAPLSGSGDFGPQLVIDNPSRLSGSVLNYLINYATPGYTSEGPTAAVYNHAWLIGGPNQLSLALQAEVDEVLQAVAQR